MTSISWQQRNSFYYCLALNHSFTFQVLNAAVMSNLVLNKSTWHLFNDFVLYMLYTNAKPWHPTLKCTKKTFHRSVCTSQSFHQPQILSGTANSRSLSQSLRTSTLQHSPKQFQTLADHGKACKQEEHFLFREIFSVSTRSKKFLQFNCVNNITLSLF